MEMKRKSLTIDAPKNDLAISFATLRNSITNSIPEYDSTSLSITVA